MRDQGRRPTDAGPFGSCLDEREPPGRRRHARPLLAVEYTPTGLRSPTAPLLEEEGDACGLAMVTQVEQPFLADGPIAWAGLPACDQPVDVGEIDLIDRAEQRLSGDEPDCGRHGAQVV